MANRKELAARQKTVKARTILEAHRPRLSFDRHLRGCPNRVRQAALARLGLERPFTARDTRAPSGAGVVRLGSIGEKPRLHEAVTGAHDGVLGYRRPDRDNTL